MDWTNTIEQQLEIYDDEVATLDKLSNELKQEESAQAKQHEEELAARTTQDLWSWEFDKTKFELKLQQETKLEETSKAQEKARANNKI